MKSEEIVFVPFSMLFENARMAAMILMDKEGIILSSNSGVFNSYGYTTEDLQGKHFSMLFTKEDRLKNLPELELRRVMQKNSSSDQNYIVHKEGSYIWSHGETILTKNKEGKEVLVKLIYDINYQKLQEKYLIKSNEELQEFNQELDKFVYSASHDLKAPVANIEALLSTLEDELSQECKTNCAEIMNMLKISVEKFKNTIADLTVAGRELAKGKSNKELLFKEIMEEIKVDLHEDIRKSKTRIIEDFEKASLIRISKKDIRSILYNLLSNAIKYRSPERAAMITITTFHTNGYIAIEIKDNGLGIKKEDQEKIFDTYTRFHTDIEGTGVGLSIVKKTVDSYNGKIEIKSKVGAGSCFKILIPTFSEEP